MDRSSTVTALLQAKRLTAPHTPPTVRIIHSGHACNVEEERHTERVYTIREGETLELTCLVTGHPRPHKNHHHANQLAVNPAEDLLLIWTIAVFTSGVSGEKSGKGPEGLPLTCALENAWRLPGVQGMTESSCSKARDDSLPRVTWAEVVVCQVQRWHHKGPATG
ncbi:unnamed protein product [Pleuronectes platessa]|uniref:Uncharacterized protein n=1 Tax=Pleuronectes platessa TaxID=8262 RepID=A0A9N7YNZ1_PLEPL|nr:unnamed protein product [Pleuronectes platessa]